MSIARDIADDINVGNVGLPLKDSNNADVLAEDINGVVTLTADQANVGSATISGGSITGTEIDLKSSGTTIFASDGTTAVLSESGGVVTLTADGVIGGYSRDTSTGGIVLYDDNQSENRLTLQTGGGAGVNAVINQPGGSLNITNASLGVVASFNDSGDISFYEDTGTTAKFFWDAEEERLYIGEGTHSNDGFFLSSFSDGYQLFNTKASDIRIATNNTERMRIDSSGTLLINVTSTNNPASKLLLKRTSVASSTSAEDLYWQAGNGLTIANDHTSSVTNSALGINFLVYNNGKATNAHIGAEAGTTTGGPANIVFGRRTGTSSYSETMRINTSGSVKINNLNASADVVTSASGYLTTSSDARLKNEIGLITESGIEVIKQIIPKYFSWKEDENNKQHLGFFAQDIHPVLPEAAPRALKYTEVGRDENDEPILEQVLDENGEPDYQWGFATQPIVAMLVKAIQEQQTLIESQQSQIDALTTRIEALESNTTT